MNYHYIPIIVNIRNNFNLLLHHSLRSSLQSLYIYYIIYENGRYNNNYLIAVFQIKNYYPLYYYERAASVRAAPFYSGFISHHGKSFKKQCCNHSHHSLL